MKSSSTLTLLALLTSALAGATTERPSCVTTKTLPPITIYSCPGDSEPTKTVFTPVQSSNPALKPGAPGSSGAPNVPGVPGAPGQPDGSEEPNAGQNDGNIPNPQQPNAPESAGSAPSPGSESGSGPNSHPGQPVGTAEPSTTGPGVAPGSPETPSVIAVAGAPTVQLDLLLFSTAALAALAMVWV
ncbi:uncharacterized protein NECHADRAFT_88323 [Fusarium vanettenii 77-13-4]|uniref:Uncharacterized protein n=1 Tax=Fusarium vanettenii (strain ATCC MYA-4622 / CBS 123669 / FGSC 9596 / NRRL 45880 / 77-13-4) TaxID=660122 RepID=C7ZDL3_FUSV7|nr:uncharacterized protein NECHADRAFT_88323 [Fusarium vanettenii 77-13-4]EEU37846.1 predicted protein [Fusarium vanettenii 77-13-4]